MSSRRSSWLLFASSVAATGCATVINTGVQQVEIRTNPPGAAALILPGRIEVQTPARVELPRGQAHTVRLALPGHCPEIAYVDRIASKVIAGNLLLGGLVGFAIDVWSEAAFQLTPDPLEVGLRPRESGATCTGTEWRD